MIIVTQHKNITLNLLLISLNNNSKKKIQIKDIFRQLFAKFIKLTVRRWPSYIIEELKVLLLENSISSLHLEPNLGIYCIGGNSENKGKKISTAYGFYNHFEPMETTLMGNLAKNSNVLFDIGANVGWYTTLFASDPTHKVFAFEPIPETFAQLRNTVSLNGFENCILEPMVVSDTVGELTMYLPLGFSYTAASLCKHQAHSTNKYVPFVCKTITLDDYISEHHIQSVDLIKCDVEGAEFSILKGAQNLLGSVDAPILLLEANPQWMVSFGYTRKDLFDFMYDMGFSIYELVEIDFHVKVKEISSSSDNINGDNFLFVKDNKKSLIESIIYK